MLVESEHKFLVDGDAWRSGLRRRGQASAVRAAP
jgi:hypothetical protein